MKVIETSIPDVKLLEPRVYEDERGFFLESYNEQALQSAIGLAASFVQDNHSHSSQGVLRGLHYQLQHPQGKLVRVITGEVYDVAVDLRNSSPSFGQWTAFILSAQNKRLAWIPPGFAHGFLVLSPTCDFFYKCTDYYHAEDEHCLLWNDPTLAIPWPLTSAPKLSPKDTKGICLKSVIAQMGTYKR
jgi:dTDP-4-dehydrorhamnose 3,5-epimerase